MENNNISDYDILGRKILIVEPNDLNFYSFERLFIHTGFKLFRVQSCKEAVKMSAKPFDLVFINILLPESMMAAKKIKSLKPYLPVLAFSNFFSEEDKQKCMEIGFDGYLSEPMDNVTLLFEIVRFMRNRFKKTTKMKIQPVY